MDFKQWTSKFNWKNGKDKWLILLAVGLILLILAFPSGDGNGGFLGGGMKNGSGKTSESLAKLAESPGDTAAEAAAQVSKTYEQQMEARVKEILSHVEGVGKVDVVVNAASITDAQRAQIEDVVKRKAEVGAENIIITLLNLEE